MGSKSLAYRIGKWALLGTPLLWPLAGSAAPPTDFSPAVHETQVILYVSMPFGTQRVVRSYGLRIDQATAPAVTPGAIALGPMHRRELVNLMITPHTRTQIELGGRLTWDLRGRQISLDRH